MLMIRLLILLARHEHKLNSKFKIKDIVKHLRLS